MLWLCVLLLQKNELTKERSLRCVRRELQISLAASKFDKCRRSMFNWDCWTPKSHKIGAQFHTTLKRQKEFDNEKEKQESVFMGVFY